MGVEIEKIKLVAHSVRTTNEGRLIVERADGEEIEVPSRFLQLFRRTMDGISLAQLIQEQRRSNGTRRFTTLLSYISFLADKGLLVDRRLIRLAEDLREDYRWPESTALGALSSIRLFTWPGGKRIPAVALIATILMVVAGLWSFMRGFGVIIVDRASGVGHISASMAVLMFILTFSLGRSMKSLMQFFAVRGVAGAEAELHLRADAVSISLQSGDVSRVNGGPLFVLATFAALLFSFAPAALLAESTRWTNLGGLIAVWTALLVLVDFSPFVRSPFTEWLRVFYNSFDHLREERGQTGYRLEGLMKGLHVSLCAFWVMGFALFLVGPGWTFISRVRAGLDLSTRVGQIGAALLALLVLVVLVSIFEDVTSSFSYGDANDRRRVRRLWKRRRAHLPVEEAIQRGKSPSRAELEQLPLLRQLDLETRRELLKRAEIVEYDEGEALCRQDSVDRTLFISLSGRLAVAKRFGQSRRKVVAILSAGSVFGEAGFFLGQKRGADVVALESTRVLAIRHDDSMKTMDTERSMELQLRIWFLQALVSGSFFKELPSEALDALIFTGKKKAFLAGERIIREGERADACYFLVQGKASIVQNMTLIARAQAGDVFGEIGLMWPDTLRTATVVADTDVLCVCIEADRFWSLLSSHLALAVELERLSEARLKVDQARKSANVA